MTEFLDRNKRRVALTQAGRELVAPLERVICDFESVLPNTRDFVEHRRGIVAVGALPSIAAGLLPRAMKQLTDLHPGIVVRVADALRDASRRWSSRGKPTSVSAFRCRPIGS